MSSITSPAIRDIPGILRRGASNYRALAGPASVMAVIVLLVYGFGRATAAALIAAGDPMSAFVVDIAALILATVVALPWFRLMVAAERGEAAGIALAVQQSLRSLMAMLLAAALFWIVVVFGIVLAAGLPSFLVLIWFGLFGFSIAHDGLSGLRALRASFRLGRRRRTVIAAFVLVLLVGNGVVVALLASGFAPLIVAGVPLLVASTNISMAAGARLYTHLKDSAVGERERGSRFM